MRGVPLVCCAGEQSQHCWLGCGACSAAFGGILIALCVCLCVCCCLDALQPTSTAWGVQPAAAAAPAAAAYSSGCMAAVGQGAPAAQQQLLVWAGQTPFHSLHPPGRHLGRAVQQLVVLVVRVVYLT